MQTAGASAFAYSYTMPTTTSVMYSQQTKRAAQTSWVKDSYDGKWKTNYQLEQEYAKRGGYNVRYYSKKPGPSARWSARNPPIGVKTTVTNPSKVVARNLTRTGGASMIIGGRALPVLATGYVGYNLLTGEDVPYQRPQYDPWGATETAMALPGMIESFEQRQLDAITLGGEIGGAALGWAQGAAARAIGFAFLQGVFG